MTGGECTSTVKVREPSVFYMIEDSDEFLEQNPRTTLIIAKMLAERLASTTRSHSIAKREVLELSREDQKHSPM